MKREEFNLINNYLNELALYIFKSNDIEKYYYNFLLLNDKYYDYIKKRYFSESNTYNCNTRDNNLEFSDIISIAREIIESINTDYLKEFDSLLDNGRLNFIYEDKYTTSYVEHVRKGNIWEKSINIGRYYNYTDVELLIHEFMHYVSGTGFEFKNSVVTEFISIYFELYANEYIYKKYKPNLNEISYNQRLLSNFERSKELCSTEVPIFMYSRFGNLDKNSYKLVNKYIFEYTKKNYENECKELLKFIQKDDKICSNHFYQMAMFLAFYVRKTNSMKNVIRLANDYSLPENQRLNIFEELEKYNIHIDADIYNVLFDAIDEYLDIFDEKKKQR